MIPNKNLVTLIKEKLQFQCIICSNEYNVTNRLPYEICSNFHNICEECHRLHYYQKVNMKCPLCRQILSSDSIKPYPQNLIKKITHLFSELNGYDQQLINRIIQTQNQLQDTREQLKIRQQLFQKAIEDKKTLQKENQKLSQKLKLQKLQLQVNTQNIIKTQNDKNKSPQSKFSQYFLQSSTPTGIIIDQQTINQIKTSTDLCLNCLIY